MVDKTLISAGLFLLGLLTLGICIMSSAKHATQVGFAHTITKKMHLGANVSGEAESTADAATTDTGVNAQSALNSATAAGSAAANSAGASSDSASNNTNDTQPSGDATSTSGTAQKPEGAQADNTNAVTPGATDQKPDGANTNADTNLSADDALNAELKKRHAVTFKTFSDIYKDKESDKDNE